MQIILDEAINKPDYYKAVNSEDIEVNDFIDAFELNFNCGNVVKYIARAGKKPGESRFQALWKAHNYLLREIVNVGKEIENDKG
ncbi:MAG: DUF3310 domain-containing protein [Synergistaceae bacterium]|nr:DUF3310 domain-containing protein [Synergistaceae bacterium]